MADITISPDEIRDALKDFVKAYEPGKAAAAEVGYVTDAATASPTSRDFLA
jgi:F-type H+-transporting ATPase subunit alpha